MKSKIQPHWLIALVAITAVTLYWHLWAEDRYVSKATVVLESPQIAPPELSFSSLMSGGTGGQKDLLLLREHLLSVDMLKRVSKEMPFREHYSQNGDWFTRLHNAEAPIEDLHDYYMKRVSVELDDYAGVLNIKVQAFNPEFAKQLADLLLEAGEAHMNEMGQRLAEEQVRFLEKQVERLHTRLMDARDDLLAYQNKEGLVAPTKTVEALNQVVAQLEGELSKLKARQKAIASYQSNQSAEMVRVKSEMDALEKQIKLERERLAKATGESLNQVSAHYQTLEIQAEFAQETYSSALAALENTRIEAARKLKQVSILQSPLMPEYPVEPERTYNSVVFALITLFLAVIVHMLILIIRDHRD
ncbi:chain-length determining protein [Guyparkeria hydrothermalis]|uniref:chain-length determining protein n=1 Tax=Guyparkeria hydrothermalis TaxID=923 RepID=UPI002020BC73|nr:chain-length determining protein [Guyparkeria hydrothermalis]MCL7745467.1 chain-length determining protein [Guyparkeria hydrothermalis]